MSRAQSQASRGHTSTYAFLLASGSLCGLCVDLWVPSKPLHTTKAFELQGLHSKPILHLLLVISVKLTRSCSSTSSSVPSPFPHHSHTAGCRRGGSDAFSIPPSVPRVTPRAPGGWGPVPRMLHAGGKGFYAPWVRPSCLSRPPKPRSRSHHAAMKQLFCTVGLSRLRNEKGHG